MIQRREKMQGEVVNFTHSLTHSLILSLIQPPFLFVGAALWKVLRTVT